LISENYLCFLEEELAVFLDVLLSVRRELWLQQDGALPRFGSQATEFPSHYFQNRLIARQVPVAGHRCHLT
jgi:hypothetical protein